MSVNMGSPAPNSGDIKVLKIGSGTLAAGAPGDVGVDSFTLPIITEGQIIKAFTYLTRTSGADNCVCSINSTNNSIDTDGVCYTTEAGTYGINLTEAFLSATTAGNVTMFRKSSTTLSVENDDNCLGDLRTAHTIYLNLRRYAGSGFTWRWIVTIEGEGVK